MFSEMDHLGGRNRVYGMQQYSALGEPGKAVTKLNETLEVILLDGTPAILRNLGENRFDIMSPVASLPKGYQRNYHAEDILFTKGRGYVVAI